MLNSTLLKYLTYLRVKTNMASIVLSVFDWMGGGMRLEELYHNICLD